MQIIFKFMAIFIIIAATVISSLFILDIISLDIAKETIFKSVFVIIIFSISSLIIMAILDKPKKKIK